MMDLASAATAATLAAAAAAAVAAAAFLYRCWTFERFLQREEQGVKDAAAPSSGGPSLAERLHGLPEPLQRFFKRSISDEECLRCRLWVARGAGSLRFEPSGGWKPLAAATIAAVGPDPAFCYTGTVQLVPGWLLPCRGREALLQGRGAMEWRLWGALPLAASQGGRLDHSALLRWLAEAVCFPPALLPSRHLTWLPAAEGEGGGPARGARAVLRCRGARAVLRCRGVAVQALLTFDEQGRFSQLETEDYWRVLPGSGEVVQAPWRARAVGGHKRFSLPGGGSVEAPTQLEAAWVEPDGSEFVHIQFGIYSLEAE
ncbi:hypothetical protein ABPG75_003671 [Micractinium tetrahymenae]